MKESELIIALMAAFGRKRYSVQTLIKLTAPFGTKESSVRTNLSRMQNRGLLITEKQGRSGYYLLGEKWRKITENIGRSFRTIEWSDWDGSWWGLLFSVPGKEKDFRYRIRKKLTAYRFAPLQAGFWIRPFHKGENIAENLSGLEKNGYARLLRFQPEKQFSYQDVSEVWRLEALNHEFENTLGKLQRITARIPGFSPREALRQRMNTGDLVINTLFKDPLLPGVFLPDKWKGDDLRELFLKWDEAVTERAMPFIEECFKEV